MFPSIIAKVVPIILIILLAVLVFTFSYIKAPPNKAFIISGPRKNARILIGRAGFIIPFLEKVDWLCLG